VSLEERVRHDHPLRATVRLGGEVIDERWWRALSGSARYVLPPSSGSAVDSAGDAANLDAAERLPDDWRWNRSYLA